MHTSKIHGVPPRASALLVTIAVAVRAALPITSQSVYIVVLISTEALRPSLQPCVRMTTESTVGYTSLYIHSAWIVEVR